MTCEELFLKTNTSISSFFMVEQVANNIVHIFWSRTNLAPHPILLDLEDRNSRSK